MTPDEYIASVTAAATSAAATSGLPAGVSIAQSALETGWGAHVPGNNYFGITGHGDLPDAQLETWEVLTPDAFAAGLHSGWIVRTLGLGTPLPGTNKLRYRIVRSFGAWSTVEKNFAARDHLIATLPVYAKAYLAWHNDRDLRGYVEGFAAHWATDPQYGLNILGTYFKHGLNTLDKVGK